VIKNDRTLTCSDDDDLRRAREIEYLRERLIKAEKSGFSKSTPEEILREAKKRVNIKNHDREGA
jgi:hypothetical protein